MILPTNYKEFPIKTLFLDYQRPALKERDMETVRVVAEECRQRLMASGLCIIRLNKREVWVNENRVKEGLTRGTLRKDFEEDTYRLVSNNTLDEKGRAKPDFKEIDYWLDTCRKRETLLQQTKTIFTGIVG